MTKHLPICILIFFVCLVVAQRAFSEVPSEIYVGVPSFSEQENLVRSDEIGATLVRNAIADPVLRGKSGARKGLFSLVLADSFQVDSDLELWSYRIRGSMVFSNGQPILASDVCHSLLQCHKVDPKRSAQFERCTARTAASESATREWVDLKFGTSINPTERQSAVVSFLENCPIFEKRTREIFGEDFGIGANLLGSGQYRLTSFQPGKEYVLERFQRDLTGRAAPQQIIGVRAFTSSRDALAALRVGNILLFYNDDHSAAESAAGDETLRIATCDGRQVIYRRELRFECGARISFDLMTTEFPK